MTRSGYHEIDDHDEADELATARFRAAVEADLASERGQAFLRKLIASLDALPTRELTASALADTTGTGCCAMGAFCRHEGHDPLDIVVVHHKYGDGYGSVRDITLREELAVIATDSPLNDSRFVAEDIEAIEAEAVDALPALLDVPEQCVRETVWTNDMCSGNSDAARWVRVRRWAVSNLAKPKDGGA